jgi:glutathione S-transferase
MVLKIHGQTFSPPTQNVLIVCKELGVEYEFVPIQFAIGEHKQPEYLQNMNPFGKFPVMDDDGFKLFESRAIARYLIEKYGGTHLMPSDAKKRALVEQAISFEQSNFNVNTFGIFREKYIRPNFLDRATDESVVKHYEELLEETLQAYEIWLGKHKYLAGDEVTLADLLHLPFGRLVELLQYKVLEAKPNVAR